MTIDSALKSSHIHTSAWPVLIQLWNVVIQLKRRSPHPKASFEEDLATERGVVYSSAAWML